MKSTKFVVAYNQQHWRILMQQMANSNNNNASLPQYVTAWRPAHGVNHWRNDCWAAIQVLRHSYTYININIYLCIEIYMFAYVMGISLTISHRVGVAAMLWLIKYFIFFLSEIYVFVVVSQRNFACCSSHVRHFGQRLC